MLFKLLLAPEIVKANLGVVIGARANGRDGGGGAYDVLVVEGRRVRIRQALMIFGSEGEIAVASGRRGELGLRCAGRRRCSCIAIVGISVVRIFEHNHFLFLLFVLVASYNFFFFFSKKIQKKKKKAQRKKKRIIL